MMGRALAVSNHLSASVASARSPAVLTKIATPDAAASPWEFPADLHGFRRVFPDKWSALLRTHFHGATHVAAFFNVDRKTAVDWLNGKTGPSGAFVVHAIATIPGALQELARPAA